MLYYIILGDKAHILYLYIIFYIKYDRYGIKNNCVEESYLYLQPPSSSIIIIIIIIIIMYSILLRFIAFVSTICTGYILYTFTYLFFHAKPFFYMVYGVIFSFIFMMVPFIPIKMIVGSKLNYPNADDFGHIQVAVAINFYAFYCAFQAHHNVNITFKNIHLREKIMGLIAELWALVLERKKYWLIPIFIMIGVFGAVVILSQGTVVAPFIYTIF